MNIAIIGFNEITEHILRYIEDICENIVIYDIQISADLKNKYKSKNNITIIEHNDIEKDLFSISEKAERLLILSKDDVKNIFFYYKIRNYNNDLSLVSRENNNSMILDHRKMLKRLENVINDNKIQTISGDYKKISADTFCVHGDSPKIINLIIDLFNNINKINLNN